MKILVVIPAYNEEENIKRVVDHLVTHHPELDYIIINDGSSDRTSEICHAEGYSIVDLPVNLGLAGAFQTGMRYAAYHGYDAAVQFDGDGQHRPEYIADMAAKIGEGYDIVIASRFVTEKKPHSLRMLGSNLIEGAIRLISGVRIKDPTSGMRMYNQRLIRVCADLEDFGPEPDTVSFLIKNGAKVAEIQAVMDERIAGESYLNLGASVKYMLRMMISILIIQNFRKTKKIFG